MAGVHRHQRRPVGRVGGRPGAAGRGSGRLPGARLPVRGRGRSDAHVRSRRPAAALAERPHPPSRRPREVRRRGAPGVRARPAGDDGRADRRWPSDARAAPRRITSQACGAGSSTTSTPTQVAALESIFTAINQGLRADPECAGRPRAARHGRPVTELPAGFRAHVANIGVKDDTDDFVVVAADAPVPVAACSPRAASPGRASRCRAAHVANGLARAVVVDLEERQRRHRAGRRRRCGRGGPHRRRSARLRARRRGRHLDRRDRPALPDGSDPCRARRDPALAAAHRCRRPGGRDDDHRHRRQGRRRPTVAGSAARVVGMAKGVGMIEPDMATHISLLFTDAEVDRRRSHEIYPRASSTARSTR